MFEINKVVRLLSFAALLLFISCSKSSTLTETAAPHSHEASATDMPAGKLLGQMIFDSVAYAIPQEDLLQPFIREFKDGTVVDKATIRRVQATKNSKPNYYLVGIGQKNGAFRMMAFDLYASSDNSLYITTAAKKYIVKSDGCEFCLFAFSGNSITGSTCESGGATCEFETEETNTFMK